MKTPTDFRKWQLHIRKQCVNCQQPDHAETIRPWNLNWTQSLTFKFDQGTLSYAQADLAEVTLQERPGVVEGRKALEDGKMEEVVGKWREPVNQFLGVDNPWVLECAGGDRKSVV